jgi:flagellar hook-length control protein FliK
MTASALNSASMSAPAAGQPGASANAGAGAAAGFDVLLATLFPQGAPTGQPDAAAAAGAATGTAAAAVPPVAPAVDGEETETEGQPVVGEEAAAGSDAAAATLAAALAVQQAITPPPAETTATDPSAQAPHAWGRDKAKGTPAQPALLHANPKADLAGKAEPTPEAAAETTAPSPELPEAAQPAAAQPPTPRASAQAVDRAALSSAVVSNMPTAVAPDVADVPVVPTPAPTETAAPEGPTEQASILAAGQAAAKAEAPGAPPPRSQRSERGKAAAETDTPSALKPTEAADKPIHAKAVDAAAKPASASADAKSPEILEPETEAAADTGDSSVPLDAKAAAQASAPAAHAAHAVRGSPETVANLAAQIIKKLEGQSTRFDLELNPNGLGKVDVRIEIGAQGQLSASMMFDNAGAAQELKSRATELQRVLEQAGFDLSGGLSFNVADQGGRQGQAWQDQGEAGSAFRGQAFRAALETAGDADIATQGALRLRRGVNAGVDVRI